MLVRESTGGVAVTDGVDHGDVTADPDLTREEASRVHATQNIGPYRLLQRVGQGGMGEVWLAEQTLPIRRNVALKVIKAGMDTAQVVARTWAKPP
jgi:eukaryotic-like serine/threonine-protein kinase